MDYSEIVPGVYLGARPTTIEDMTWLVTAADLVIGFNGIDDHKAFEVISNSCTTEQRHEFDKRIVEMIWQHYPINDDSKRGAVSQYKLALLDFINARTQDFKIYVHCKNGKHRSSHFFIFMLMLAGMDYDSALDYMISRRNEVEARPNLKQQLLDYFYKGT
jgi:protein-tyrosine phosphatase